MSSPHPLPAVSSLLEDLLGGRRALILEQLDAPASCGEIARALDTVPAGATHHLRTLEAAGLVVRRRNGRRVMVERTERGSELLALYHEAEDQRRSRTLENAG